MSDETMAVRRNLAAAGAVLFGVGMVTGLWLAAAATGDFPALTKQLARGAHLNGLLGGLWMIAVAWTFEFLGYQSRGLRRLAWLVGLAAWSNWLVTLIASLLNVNGLKYDANPRNNVIAVLLQTTVVLPTLIGCVVWAWGFRRTKRRLGPEN
ncbi:MAG: hypothetical protein ABIP75_18515 [Pyrinomonadaceae bacterium]